MKKKLMKSIATLAGLSMLTRGLGFVYKIFLSRYLGAEKLGVLQIATTVFFLLLSLCVGGIPTYLSRRIAENTEKGKSSASLLGGGLIITVSIALSLIFIFTLGAGLLPYLFSDERCVPVFLLMLPALVSSSVYGVIRSWFWGNRHYNLFGVSELFEEAVKIIITFVIITMPVFNLCRQNGVAICFTAADFLCCAFLIVLFIVKGGRAAKPQDLSDIVRHSSPLTVTRLFSGVMSTVIATLLPALLILFGSNAAEATADFGRASGMALPLLTAPMNITAAVSIALVPEIATLKSKGDYAEIGEKTNSVIITAVLFAGIFVSCYVACGERLCELLYFDGRAGRFLVYAAVAMVPLTINQIAGSALNGLGKEKLTMRVFFIDSAVTLACILLLTKPLGIYSLAATYFISTAVSSCLLTRYLDKQHGRRASLPLMGGLCCALSVFAGACARFFMQNTTIQSNFWCIAILCTVATTVYACPIAVLKLIKQQKAKPHLAAKGVV